LLFCCFITESVNLYLFCRSVLLEMKMYNAFSRQNFVRTNTLYYVSLVYTVSVSVLHSFLCSFLTTGHRSLVSFSSHAFLYNNNLKHKLVLYSCVCSHSLFVCFVSILLSIHSQFESVSTALFRVDFKSKICILVVNEMLNQIKLFSTLFVKKITFCYLFCENKTTKPLSLL
jgi:hypothetical protein